MLPPCRNYKGRRLTSYRQMALKAGQICMSGYQHARISFLAVSSNDARAAADPQVLMDEPFGSWTRQRGVTKQAHALCWSLMMRRLYLVLIVHAVICGRQSLTMLTA